MILNEIPKAWYKPSVLSVCICLNPNKTTIGLNKFARVSLTQRARAFVYVRFRFKCWPTIWVMLFSFLFLLLFCFAFLLYIFRLCITWYMNNIQNIHTKKLIHYQENKYTSLSIHIAFGIISWNLHFVLMLIFSFSPVAERIFIISLKFHNQRLWGKNRTFTYTRTRTHAQFKSNGFICPLYRMIKRSTNTSFENVYKTYESFTLNIFRFFLFKFNRNGRRRAFDCTLHHRFRSCLSRIY